MITQEENDLLTKTGTGTPCGELMRRYWQPAALSEELAANNPLPVTIFGEELILFRDGSGQAGLIGRYCAHQGVDMIYGRIETEGIRCMYHGWLFDRCGKLVVSGEWVPDGAKRMSVGQPAYPCQEAGGVIFTYMGPGDPPPLPAYEFLTVPAAQRAVTKILLNCNYLQANEGNIDPLHLSFLHRNLQDTARDKARVVPGSNASPNSLVGKDQTPTIEVEVTDFGLRIYTIRKPGDGKQYLRVTNFILPNLAAFNGSTTGEGYSAHWHVPIDDHSHWKYAFLFSRERPLTDELRNRIRVEMADDNRLKRNQANRYLQDRATMTAQTFSGMGFHFHAQDAFATESQGAVQNRAAEHLVSSDKPLVAARKLLLKAIDDVREGRHAPYSADESNTTPIADIVVLSEVIAGEANPREYVKNLAYRNLPSQSA
ncbi:MAG TPA: Rieske 2Fe-2S domain-containing protein [Candidatus Binatus sp.]|nr:Rieske 2Fe-2S domain-containing protein [Candidatus Binatus sp.]